MLPRQIVLATANRGKLAELQQMLAPLGLDVVSQATRGVTPVEETGLTFVENALLKARHACLHTGLPAIGDDSGIEVDALNGAPGIYSARYAGPDATDEENNRLLPSLASALRSSGWKMIGTAKTNRMAARVTIHEITSNSNSRSNSVIATRMTTRPTRMRAPRVARKARKI